MESIRVGHYTQEKVVVTRENGGPVLEREAWCFTFQPDEQHAG